MSELFRITTGLILSTEPTVAGGWRLTISAWRYLVYCFIATLVVRFIICFFKAIETAENSSAGTFGERYREALNGFRGPANVQDHWLTTVIGFCEAAAYPVLIFLDHGIIIGGWLAIKTAGQWSAWQNSRTTFNRFLIGNLIVLAASFFWLLRFVTSTI